MSSPHIRLLSHNQFDALDRLIRQTHTDTAAHQRFYCKSRLTTEIQGALHYSFLQHEDQLLAQKQNLDNKHDTTLLATDLQRSVLRTLEADHQRRPIAYTPYGHRIAESGLSSLLGFNGQRSDPVTGHYLLGNGYRAFNPVLLRFNSPDSLSPFGKGGLNSYVYCLNDPINRADHDGHNSISILLSARLVIKGRRAAARVVAKTNTIVLDGGSRHALKPGVTPMEAVNARARMNKLMELADSNSARAKKYAFDLAEEKHSSAVMENMLGLPGDSNERLKLLQYIKSDKFPGYSRDRLIGAGYGDFDSLVPRGGRPSKTIAKNYEDELYSFDQGRARLLFEEYLRVEKLNFIKLQKSSTAIRR